MATKYIFVTGGVVSGLGKGITAASLGRLLKARNKRITLQKFDPYINLDPGRMSPYQHGEVFVTEDGAECDLDVGHYERFADENLTVNSNITSGKIYWSVISKEMEGEYNGKTVQVIPHITNEIKERIFKAGKAKNTDIVITEIGGTVGDIESLPFLEAIRQVANDVGRENCMYIHVTLVPYVSTSGEPKSKPTQHSVKELLSLGIQPDVVVCRTSSALSEEFKAKIALFCNLSSNAVIQNVDVDTIYEVPLLLEQEGLANVVCKRLSIENVQPDLDMWKNMVLKAKNISRTIKVALVGKYVELHDAYLSLVEAVNHAAIELSVDVRIEWVNSETLTEENADEILGGVCGIVVPGGFGDRGIDGMICAINYARIRNIPFFGVGIGMQMACVEFARNVAGLNGAHSEEIDSISPYKIFEIRESKQMRLGVSPCKIENGTRAKGAYNEEIIYERHRNKYEFNGEYANTLIGHGMVIAGISPDGSTVEIVEVPDHAWFTGVLFEPQFKSRPNRPHPLIKDFLKAALKNS